MVKIFLDPGHGGNDPGASGNGLLEKNVTLNIANRIRNILVDEYENVSIRMSRTTDKTVSLTQRTNAANSWGADIYLSIHVNAGGGNGFESHVYPNVGRPTTTYQNNIHEEVLKQVDFVNRGRKQSNFHVLRESNMDAILTENGFIDTRSDADKLKSNAFLNRLARGHVNGIVESFNLRRKPQEDDTDDNTEDRDGLSKVQIGAFSKKSNAEALASNAESRGFDTFVSFEGGLFKVQLGAFSERDDAEQLAERANRAGFSVFIVNE